MAESGLKLKRYINLIRRLLPRGFAWDRKNDDDSGMGKLIKVIANEACRVDDRALDLVKEVIPFTTSELLEDWERLLGLPDECSPDESLTIQERRDRVLQVLTTRGGQNEEFFIELASNFGYDIDVLEVKDNPPFRAGQSRAGDRLTNGDWRYAFIVEAPADSVVRFRAGQSRAGDRLLVVTSDTLECLIEKHKPAHTISIFSFGEY